MDILELRSLVTNTLDTKLGLYYLGNDTTPAICVLPDEIYGYYYPPDEITVEGIEVALLRPPKEIKQLLGRDLVVKDVIEIYLKYWNGANDLNDCSFLLVEALQDNGYNFESPYFVPAIKKISSPPNVMIRLFDHGARIAMPVP